MAKLKTIYSLEEIWSLRKIILLLITFTICGCASLNTPKVPTGWVELPFAADKSDSVIETEFRSVEDRSYTFTLNIWFKDMGDNVLIQKLANTGRGGVAIQVELEVLALDEANKASSFRQRIDVRERISSGFPKDHPYRSQGYKGHRNRLITYARLKPGYYRIRVKNIHDVPALAGIPVDFRISYNPKLIPNT